jgi:hypothetical protein
MKPEVKVIGKIELPKEKEKISNSIEKFKKKKEIAQELKPIAPKKARVKKEKNTINLLTQVEIPRQIAIIRHPNKLSKTFYKLMAKNNCSTADEYRKLRNAKLKRLRK